MSERPTLAVWKFASCDGCQLTLLSLEDELLAVAERLEIAYFPEASRAMSEGPYDVSLVEGSITTEHDARRIREIRERTTTLVTIGACATAGGIQALRNTTALDTYLATVYPEPDYIDALSTSTPIADHVPVDLELRGCPIDGGQLVTAITALLDGRTPRLPTYSVCVECKLRGTPCVLVSRGIPCLGPVTIAGCGALCPAVDRGCYGCFGPMETPNTTALGDHLRDELGVTEADLVRSFRTFNAAAPAFEEEARARAADAIEEADR
jgi:sulfhydrogenase subunit delta